MHHKDLFHEQDSEARSLLDDICEKHLIWMNHKSNSVKKSAYVQARGAVQRRFRQMRDLVVCNSRAAAACRRPSQHKAFYDGLKAVYGPKDTGSIPVCWKDGKMLIIDRAGILSRWAEHFH